MRNHVKMVYFKINRNDIQSVIMEPTNLNESKLKELREV